MTALYNPVYKCLLCGELTPAATVELQSDKLVEAIARIENMQKFRVNPALAKDIVPINLVHHCNNGYAGYAYFAGFRLADNGR